MEIACIVIIDPKEELEFIETYLKSSDNCLFQFHAFAALSQINSLLLKRLNAQTPDPYLGWVYQIYLPEHDYDIYGYVTVSQYKFLIFLKQNTKQERTNMQLIFENIYGLYRSSKCNPFGKVSLNKLLRPLVRSYNNF